MAAAIRRARRLIVGAEYVADGPLTKEEVEAEEALYAP